MQGLVDYFHPAGQLKTLTLSKGRSALEQAIIEWLPAKSTWAILPGDSGTLLQVNGRPVSFGSSVVLNHFDIITLGSLRARFLRTPDLPTLRSRPCAEIFLDHRKLLIGRSESAEVTDDGNNSAQTRWLLDPEDRAVSKLHVEIYPEANGYVIHDRSRTGTYLNGSVFQQRQLVPGDRFNISSYHFEFTGSSVRCVDQLLGARVESHDLSLTVPYRRGTKQILRGVSIEIKAGEFIGILGGSGQGKSTLMNLLAGLLRPTRGTVLIDGDSISKRLPNGTMVGFVPQDDIVHSELTVRQAITLTARLRLAVSPSSIEALVSGTIKKLGLEPHEHQNIYSLSGGQRKRVNIATELLTRPSVLFLDEPTSGLDPENEESVVSTLQNLRLTGQTVVCTTHSLHKAYLFDRIAFIHDGRLMFLGSQDEAREHFLDVKEDTRRTETSGPAVRLERIYKLVSQQKNVEKWHQKFLQSSLAPFSGAVHPPQRRVVAKQPQQARPGFLGSLIVLVQTQWRILMSDRKNWQSLLLQSLGIGTLAGWVGMHDPEFRFFACLIATLWFGCSNAAQTIVRELPIFRRERIAGLGMHSYILSKTVFLSLIACAQVIMLLTAQALPVLLFAKDGNPAHDLAPAGLGFAIFALAFTLIGIVGVQIGLALSSMARTATQATLWVPLALIPQILFSGFVVTLPEMPDYARHFSHLVPSASAQHLIDIANVTGKRIPLMTDKTETPMFFWTRFSKEDGPEIKLDPKGLEPEDVKGRHGSKDWSYRELDEYNTSWQNIIVNADKVGTFDPGNSKKGNDDESHVYARADILNPGGKAAESGQTCTPLTHALPSVISLLSWIAVCYALIWCGLSLAQPAILRPRWMAKT